MTAEPVRSMTPLEMARHRVAVWMTRLGRKFPRLVWYGDEVEVLVTLKSGGLPYGLTPDEALKELWSGPVHDAEKAMGRLGVTFDKGMGFQGRDWEWDYSLKGPISVTFKRRKKT